MQIMRRRSIFFINPWSGIIGPNVGMRQIAEEALNRGHTVHIVTAVSDAFSDALARQSAIMHYWPALELTQRCGNLWILMSHLVRGWRIAFKLGQLVQRVTADVVCINGENMLLAPRAGKIAKVPTVVINRGARFEEMGIIAKIYFTIQKRWVCHYVPVSEKARRGLIRVGIMPERITLIRNGVNLAEYDHAESNPELAKSLGIQPGTMVIGAVGHTEPIKGMHHLVDAFILIAKQMPDVACLLIGGTNDPKASAYVESLHLQAMKYGMRKRIIFTGYRKDVPELLRLIDVYVHPSETENCPRAVIEAQACSRPVVGFDVGGMQEVVANGKTGILVAPFDITEMGKAIEKLLKDRGLREKMGQDGRQRVCKLYNLKNTISEMVNILEKISDATSTTS